MDEPKKILIDFGKLKNRYTGLGEVSYNFAKTLSENIDSLKKGNIEVYYLLPAACKGVFGNEVKYVALNFFRRHFPFLNKHYHLWYALHQDSSYFPAGRKTKYLLTIHDLNFIFKSSKKKVAKRTKKLNERIKRACYITAISNFTKNEIINHAEVTDKTIEVIYCGVVNPNTIEGEKPLAINERFFLHISTITPKKNVMTLVEMMKLMPEKKLIIAGSWDDDYAKNILEKIKNENISNIITLSKVNDGQKAWLYQNCEAVFFPSLHEGFGLPVIEGMYCGKPVFISTCTSLPETGSNKAFYWNNFEPQYMKNIVIEKMEAIKNENAFGQALQQYAHSFTWQKNVERYINLFKELLSN